MGVEAGKDLLVTVGVDLRAEPVSFAARELTARWETTYMLLLDVRRGVDLLRVLPVSVLCVQYRLGWRRGYQHGLDTGPAGI